MPLPTRGAPALLLAAALSGLVAGCNRGGSGNPSPSLTVLATTPPSGALAVEPETSIGLTLAAGSRLLTAADVIVTDGSNRLPGTVTRVGDSSEWRWTPVGELPRSATIVVATSQQGVLSTFTVRDSLTSFSVELPLEEAESALSWRNGRSALRTRSGRVFELVGQTLVERFCQMPPGARAVGDDRFVGEQEELGVRYCVRGSLAGDFDRVPTPLGAPLGDVNDAGDVVVLVPSGVGSLAEQGLWRLGREATIFDLVGPISLADVVDRPSIEGDGTVSIAWAEQGAIHLARFAPGNLAGERLTLDLDGAVPLAAAGAQYDAADDGRGVLGFINSITDPLGGPATRFVVRVARYEPGSGLRLLPDELRSWPALLGPGSLFWRVDDVVVGAQGSAAIVLAHGTSLSGQISYRYEVARVEPDQLSFPAMPLAEAIAAAPGFPPLVRPFSSIRGSPGRAELWGMSTLPQLDSVVMTRSRPRNGDVASSIVYTFASNRNHGDWCFTFDDSGRGFYAVVEWELLGPLVGTRLIVIE